MKWSFHGDITSSWPLTLASLIPVLLHVMTVGVAGQEGHDIRHGRRYNNYNYNQYNKLPPLPPNQRHKTEFDYEDSTQVLHPEFVNTKTNVTVRAGEMTTLPCAVRNLGTKQVVWRRLYPEGEPMVLTVGDFIWARKKEIKVEYKLDQGFVTHWNLQVLKVQPDDQGTYECQITDKDVIRWHVHLRVEPKRIFNPTVQLTGSEYVDSGEMIRLTCNATGGKHIPEDIDWFKDGTKLSMREDRPGLELTKHMSIQTGSLISELTIAHAVDSDSGSFICRSSDREIDSLKVTVLIAPDSSNVKRGTGSLTDRESDDNGSLAAQTASTTLLLTSLFVVLLLRLPQKNLVFS